MEISNVKQKKMLVQLLLFSMIMSVSYLIVEIFFINQSLIKIKNGLILSPAAIEDIELQARVISGVGLGLFIFSYIVNWDAKKFKRGQSLENASSLKGYIQKFVFIMLISVPLMYGIQAFYVSKIETFTGFKKLVAERLFKQGIAQVDQSNDKPLSHALTVAKASMTAQNTDAFYAIDHDDLIAADKILADSQTVERYEAYKTLHTLLISYHAIINNMYSLNSIVIQNPPEELKAFNQTLIDLDEALTVMYAPYSQMQDYVLEEMFKRFQKRGQYTRLKLALAKVRKYPKNSKPYRKYRDLAHDQLELSAKPFHKTKNFIYYGGESVLENGVICSNFRCPSERVVFNNILKANNYKTQEELVRTVLEANDKVSVFAADKYHFLDDLAIRDMALREVDEKPQFKDLLNLYVEVRGSSLGEEIAYMSDQHFLRTGGKTIDVFGATINPFRNHFLGLKMAKLYYPLLMDLYDLGLDLTQKPIQSMSLDQIFNDDQVQLAFAKLMEDSYFKVDKRLKSIDSFRASVSHSFGSKDKRKVLLHKYQSATQAFSNTKPVEGKVRWYGYGDYDVLHIVLKNRSEQGKLFAKLHYAINLAIYISLFFIIITLFRLPWVFFNFVLFRSDTENARWLSSVCKVATVVIMLSSVLGVFQSIPSDWREENPELNPHVGIKSFVYFQTFVNRLAG